MSAGDLDLIFDITILTISSKRNEEPVREDQWMANLEEKLH